MRARRRLVALAGTVLAVTLLGAGPAGADPVTDSPTPPSDPPSPTQAQLDRSITVFTHMAITTYVLETSITTLDMTTRDSGETTISLASDILFEPDAWDIPAPAADRIVELVQAAPDGATVQVNGHTDSVDGAVPNQELSQHRAEAVAAVIAAARPDLQLQVAGLADTQPAVTEDPQDPATFAANRRVEIVYEG